MGGGPINNKRCKVGHTSGHRIAKEVSDHPGPGSKMKGMFLQILHKYYGVGPAKLILVKVCNRSCPFHQPLHFVHPENTTNGGIRCPEALPHPRIVIVTDFSAVTTDAWQFEADTTKRVNRVQLGAFIVDTVYKIRLVLKVIFLQDFVEILEVSINWILGCCFSPEIRKWFWVWKFQV